MVGNWNEILLGESRRRYTAQTDNPGSDVYSFLSSVFGYRETTRLGLLGIHGASIIDSLIAAHLFLALLRTSLQDQGEGRQRVVVVPSPGFTWAANPWIRRFVSPGNHVTV
jgi:hypothetical protein